MKSTTLVATVESMGLFGTAQRQYEPDGPPRIPKIGDVVELYGKLTRGIFTTKTKRQVYVPIDSNKEKEVTK